MKFFKIFQFLGIILFFSIFSFAFSGNSSNYSIESSFGLVNSQNNLSNTYFSGSGISQNYFTQLGFQNYSYCPENWTYSEWSSCSNSIQTRTAIDTNNCGTIYFREGISKYCSSISGGGGGGGSSATYKINDNTINNTNSNSSNSNDNLLNLSSENEDKFQNLEKGKIILDENQNLKNYYQVFIEDESFSNQVIQEKKRIKIKDLYTENILLEFEFDFSSYSLDLNSFELEKSNKNNLSYTIVKGLNLNGETKKIRLEILNNFNFICIKDSNINSIDEISENCDGIDEYIIKCDESNNAKYTCSKESNYYLISGLEHSGVIEFKGNSLELNETPISNDMQLEDKNLVNDILDKIILHIKKNSIYYIIAIFIFIIFLILIKIISSKNKKKVKSNIYNSQINQNEYTLYQIEYNNAKNYLEKYKANYAKDKLIAALRKTGYPEDIIQRLIKEEYGE